MAILRKIILIFLLFSISIPSHAITTGVAIAQAKDAIDEVIQNAFDRLDFSLLQAGIEARSVVYAAADSLEDVVDLSLNQLDEQQRRMVSDLQQFERKVATDVRGALDELRNEKNHAISDLRLLVSRNPGAIQIIPGYALEGARYLDYKLRGTALSRFKIEKLRLNSANSGFSILSQSDLEVKIRVPISSSQATNAIKRNRNKPGEFTISFELVEKTLLGFGGDKRRYSATGYIVPKLIGEAIGVFVGEYEKKKYSEKPFKHSQPLKPVKRSVKITGRKRGRAKISYTLNPNHGWFFDHTRARVNLNFSSKHCSKTSHIAFSSKSRRQLPVVGELVSHLGVDSGWCRASAEVISPMWKSQIEKKELFIKSQPITANNDLKFSLSQSQLGKYKNIRLAHIIVKSPLFEDGTKYFQANQSQDGIAITYDGATQIGYLRFTNLR